MKIGITGCAGRMGIEILKQLLSMKNVEISGAIEKPHSQFIGLDIGDVMFSAKKGLIIKDNPLELFNNSDVVIDFSNYIASVEYAKYSAETNTPLIIGTTGFNDQQNKEIEAFSQKAPILKAANMSLGINLLLALVEKAAKILDDDFDIEILEIHHNQKKDAPSGTALSFGEAVARGKNKKLKDVITSVDRNGLREKGKVGFAVMRGGDIVGEHDIVFAGSGERLVLSHKADSRVIFAKGAIKAAQWILGKPNGLYKMSDVLGLDKIS